MLQFIIAVSFVGTDITLKIPGGIVSFIVNVLVSEMFVRFPSEQFTSHVYSPRVTLILKFVNVPFWTVWFVWFEFPFMKSVQAKLLVTL